MKKFILASQSPRRKEFLEGLGYEFSIISADINEAPKKAEKPRDYVKRVAIEKALEVRKNNQNKAILSADTVIAVGRNLIGKAKNKEDAFNIIKKLSGTSHRVYSAVCLIDESGVIKSKVVETRVKFRPLNHKQIEEYVAKEENWKGFAGAYAIQSAKGSSLVKSIVGSYSSVVGLPLYETECLLESLK